MINNQPICYWSSKTSPFFLGDQEPDQYVEGFVDVRVKASLLDAENEIVRGCPDGEVHLPGEADEEVTREECPLDQPGYRYHMSGDALPGGIGIIGLLVREDDIFVIGLGRNGSKEGQ